MEINETSDAILESKKYKSLSEYTEIAHKLISNWRKHRGYIKISDDLVGCIVYRMAYADSKYDAAKSTLSAYQYRQMMGIYAIRDYIDKLIKQKMRSKKFRALVREYAYLKDFYHYDDAADRDIDHVVNLEKKNKLLKFFIGNSGLTKLQRKCLELSLSGKRPQEIATINNCDVDNVYTNIYASITKMKRISSGRKYNLDLLD